MTLSIANRRYLVVFAVLAIAPARAEVLVDAAVLEALEHGRVRVIVALTLPDGFTPVGELSEAQAQAQGEAIAAAQEFVLAQLADTDARLLRRTKTAPFLAIEIGPDALATLRGLPEQVKRVYPEGTAKPTQ